MDALLTQRTIAQRSVTEGGWYLMLVNFDFNVRSFVVAGVGSLVLLLSLGDAAQVLAQ